MQKSLLTRRRFQFAGAIFIAALLPYATRGALEFREFGEPASLNALMGNILAITIALWMRLSIETYPGIRSTYVIFPQRFLATGLCRRFAPERACPRSAWADVGFSLPRAWNLFRSILR